MIKDIINWYYNLFDNKLKKNNFIVIIIVSIMVFSIWLFLPNNNHKYLKSNLLESKNSYINKVVNIDWVKYRLVVDN